MVSYETHRLSTTSWCVPGCKNQGNPTPGGVERRAPNKVRLFQVNKSYKICAVTLLIMALSVTPTLVTNEIPVEEGEMEIWVELNTLLEEKRQVPTTADFEKFCQPDIAHEPDTAHEIVLVKAIKSWQEQTNQGDEVVVDEWIDDGLTFRYFAKMANFYCMSIYVLNSVRGANAKASRKRRYRVNTPIEALDQMSNPQCPANTCTPWTTEEEGLLLQQLEGMRAARQKKARKSKNAMAFPAFRNCDTQATDNSWGTIAGYAGAPMFSPISDAFGEEGAFCDIDRAYCGLLRKRFNKNTVRRIGDYYYLKNMQAFVEAKNYMIVAAKLSLAFKDPKCSGDSTKNESMPAFTRDVDPDADPDM